MKISHFPKWCAGVYNAISMVEVMIVLAIIGLLTDIAVPNFVKAREQVEKNRIVEQQKAQQSLNVGDTVKVKGLDRNGTINYINESGNVDVLIVGNNGEPTILKGINSTLVSK